ncbi:hypothetical protein Btru_064660 [Bulinus truncatus]|nr:hypothetical protein Btru_064660 [Bulinus truncatus]
MQARRDLKLDEKDSRVKSSSGTQTQSKGVNTDNLDTGNKETFIADGEHHKKTSEGKNLKLTLVEDIILLLLSLLSVNNILFYLDFEEQTPHVQLDTGLAPKPVPLDDSLITFPEVFKEKEREGGPAAEFYGLVKSLLIACISKDQKSMQDLTHSLLSWTNHIVEIAESVVIHCPAIIDRSELGQLAQELDKTAAEVIHRSKFVVAGDVSLVRELSVTSLLWAQQLTRARLIIDATTDIFMTVTNALCNYVQVGPEHKRNIQLDAINRSQKELCSLLTALKFITGKYMDNGSEKMGFLNQSLNEIENLTATIQTTVDVSAVTALTAANDLWQFRMACRDWSVLMFCALAECEDLCNRLEVLGQQKFLGLQNSTTKDALKTCDIMERETNFLLELVDCVVLGDATSKERSEPLVSELQAALSNAWAVAKREVNKSVSVLSALFDRLKFRSAQNIWIEKAIDLKLFVRNNCFDYMGFSRQILLDVQNVSLSNELTLETKTAKRNFLSSQLLSTSNELKQKVLKSLQLSPDLVRRTVIRSTLDDLAKITTEISLLIREKSMISDAEVDFYTEQWGGKMKKLLVNLKKLDGIRQTTVTDLEIMNNKGLQGAVVSNGRLEYTQVKQQQEPSLHPATNHQSLLQPAIPTVQLLSQDLQSSLQINPDLLPQQHYLPAQLQSSVPPPVNFSTRLSNEQFISQQPALLQTNIQHVMGPASQFASSMPLVQHTEAQSASKLSIHQPLTPSLQLHTNPRVASNHQTLPTILVSFPKTTNVRTLPQHRQPENDFLLTSKLSSHTGHSEVSTLLGSDRFHLPPASGNVFDTLSLESNMPHTSSQTGRDHSDQFKLPDSDVNTNSPMGKSVSVLLKDAQYLGIRLRKWQESMTHLDGQERSAVVHEALEMARLCSKMALFTKGQGPYKASSEVVSAAVSVVNYSKKIESFANRLHSLAGQCWLADHLKMCILKMNGCSSQLQIIATALHNSPKSHQGDRILVRNASSLLTTVRQMFALVESIAAMGIPDPSSRDEFTNEIISLLVKIRIANESYLSEERKSSQIDELGLRRVELHNPPSLASSIRIKDT